MTDRLQQESFAEPAGGAPARPAKARRADQRGLHLSDEDVALLQRAVGAAMDDIAARYYLESADQARVSVSSDAIRITIPIEKLR